VQPETLAQGTSLDGRYRLEQLVSAADGCALWRAVDTVLSRSVAVRTLDADSPSADAVLSAARAASVVGDPRLVRILDASRSEGVVYVVTEWVDGTTLDEMLAAGPLDTSEAALVVGEVAEAVATAQRMGVPHLRLHPRNVLRSRSGEIRVSDLGVAAALAGSVAHDPAREDARALGALLYACLTARWPGPGDYGLPPAPLEDDRVCTPRQVLGGVSSRLDAITERAMQDAPRRGGLPLQSPDEVAAALAEVPRPAPTHATMALPMPTPEQLAPHTNGEQDTSVQQSSWAPPPYEPAYERAPQPAPRRRAAAPEPSRGTVLARRTLGAVVVIAVLVAIWQVALEAVRPNQGGQPQGSPSASSSASAAPTTLPIASVTDFDPEGDNTEHANQVDLATDGDPTTAWETMAYYHDPKLGGLKSGVGLLLDLGGAKKVRSVTVRVEGTGTDLQLRGATSRGQAASDYTVLDSAVGATGSVTLKPGKPTRERYLVVWLTKLPPSGGNYRGGIDEVKVRG